MQPESDKFRKLMLKKQKRESRKSKNVLSEFKSEDISGHKFEDLDSVLQVRSMSHFQSSYSAPCRVLGKPRRRRR